MTRDLLVAAAHTGGTSQASPWLSYAAVGIAGLSLVVSVFMGLSNRSTAKRALALSERQEARREAKIDVYLNESLSWRRRPNGGRLLGFHILASNPTDGPNAIKAAELHLTYDADGVVTVLKVSATDTPPTAIDLTPFTLPVRLDATDAKTGWLLFDVLPGLTRNHEIDRYDLVIRDVHDIEETRQVTIFREATGEQAN